MVRRSLSARIGMGIELHEIIIRLDRFSPPTVELRGQLVGTADRRAGAASSAVVTTLHLTEDGERFIESMRQAFASTEARV